MSSNLLESTGEGSNRKRSTSPIRKYLVNKPSSSSPTSSKPLSSPHDNVKPTATRTSTTTATATKTVATKKKSTNATSGTVPKRSLLDMMKASSRKSCIALSSIPKETPSSSTKVVETQPIATTNEFKPGTLKRSHSAISSLDTCNETWINRPLKQKTYNKEAYDRLTPGITDMSSAQVLIGKSSSSQQSSQTTTPDDTSFSNGESYQEQVAKACGIDSTRRILSFTPKAPTRPKVDLSKNSSQSELNTHTAPETKRRIRSSPEKILDAPQMADDYYLNVLDWSSRNVVAVGLGNSVYLWNADNGSIRQLAYDYNDPVASVAWSKEGTYLAVGTTSGDTQIWDAQQNSKLRSMKGQDCRVGVLSWDNHLVSSGGRDGSIWHHDVRLPNHKVMELFGHVDDVCGLKWRWDGQLLASGGNDNTVNIWDARSTSPKYTKRNHIGAIKALAWCPWNHNVLATGGGRDDKNIHFWNTTTGTRMNTIHAGSQITSLHWSKHFKEITSTHGYPHNQVTVWGYPSLNKIIDIPAHESRILHSTLSPDGQVLATAAADENLKFWRIFEHNGKSPLLGLESNRLTEKRQLCLKRSKTIR